MKDLLRKYNDNADVVDELIEKKLKLKLYRDHPELPDREREREREGEIYRERESERERDRESKRWQDLRLYKYWDCFDEQDIETTTTAQELRNERQLSLADAQLLRPPPENKSLALLILDVPVKFRILKTINL